PAKLLLTAPTLPCRPQEPAGRAGIDQLRPFVEEDIGRDGAEPHERRPEQGSRRRFADPVEDGQHVDAVSSSSGTDDEFVRLDPDHAADARAEVIWRAMAACAGVDYMRTRT